MKKLKEIRGNCFYVLESMSSARTCYFESEEEINYFKKLVGVYLKKFLRIEEMYLASEGFQMLVRLRDVKTIKKYYLERIFKQGKAEFSKTKESSWQIISEQVRILLSRYARYANKRRGRKGVLVQSNYKRYYFDSLEEYELYVEERKKKRERFRIKSQRKKRYRVGKKWRKMVKWKMVWGKLRSEGLVGRAFPNDVALKLINRTVKAHAP